MSATVMGATSVLASPADRGVRVGQKDVVEGDLSAERNIRTGVVHVVSLDTFVHDAVSTANHGFAVSAYVISEAKAWTEILPVIVTQPLGIHRPHTDTIDIELAWQCGIRAGSKSWAGSG